MRRLRSAIPSLLLLTVLSLCTGSALADSTVNMKLPVPEPAIMALFGTGLLSLAGIARQKLGKA
jgi:hypothetical protein